MTRGLPDRGVCAASRQKRPVRRSGHGVENSREETEATARPAVRHSGALCQVQSVPFPPVCTDPGHRASPEWPRRLLSSGSGGGQRQVAREENAVFVSHRSGQNPPRRPLTLIRSPASLARVSLGLAGPQGHSRARPSVPRRSQIWTFVVSPSSWDLWDVAVEGGV